MFQLRCFSRENFNIYRGAKTNIVCFSFMYFFIISLFFVTFNFFFIFQIVAYSLCVSSILVSLSFSFFRTIIFFSSPREASLVPEPCTLLYQDERVQLSKNNKITLPYSAEKSVRDGLPYEMLLVSLRDECIELLEYYVTYIQSVS